MTTTTLEAPIRVKELNQKIGAWISRLGHVHVEGQVTQVNRRPGTRTAFLTLRDPDAAASVSVTTAPNLIPADMKDGDRVIVFGKPSLWQGRCALSLRAQMIHQVGEGDLLQRIEKFRQVLTAEGATQPGRKKPLPMLPRRIGLITGAESAAERDVISVAINRWPMADFEVINTPVQGPGTAREVSKAIAALDKMPDVDVIIVARGGGSVEDLLPFSGEQIVRAAMACTTPLISAIGHEPDNPVLDDVADFRAATPTDAAKNVVPDALAEQAELIRRQDAVGAAIGRSLARELDGLSATKQRVNRLGSEIFAREQTVLSGWRAQFDYTMDSSLRGQRSDLDNLAYRITYANPRKRVESEHAALTGLREHLDAVSPQAVMERGFSIVTDVSNRVITSASQVSGGARLTITFADGSTRDVMAMALPHASVGIKPEEGSTEQ